MRFNINLASQPYEAARQYRRRLGALIAALGVLAALLIGYIAYQRMHSRSINRQLAAVRREISGLDAEESQARSILSRPENRVVADQSEFLNQLFARKALSWTRVFTEMERIVPPSLHVVSMKPEYNRTGDLIVHIVVATDSRDRAVELVRRMESSNHFRQAQVVAENVTTLSGGDQSAGSGNIQFDIAAIYIPGAQDNEAEQPDKTKAQGNASVQPTVANPVQARNAPAQAMRQRQH